MHLGRNAISILACPVFKEDPLPRMNLIPSRPAPRLGASGAQTGKPLATDGKRNASPPHDNLVAYVNADYPQAESSESILDVINGEVDSEESADSEEGPLPYKKVEEIMMVNLNIEEVEDLGDASALPQN
jgi:hypothetical protein